MMRQPSPFATDGAPRRQSGFSLIELMIAITISLLIMVALIAVLLNVSRSNIEMAKVNSQIENGRYAMQILEADIVHAGFWGTYVPQFDDLTATAIPSDTPAAVPDPCLAYSVADWTTAHKNNLLGIPAHSYDAAPAGCTAVVTNKKAGTDVLVVRHAETCVPGVGSCAAATAGKLYFQASLCAATAQTATSTSITLAANASATDDYYNALTIRTTGGTGVGQSRTVSAYNGATKVATLSAAWATTPNTTTTYTIGADNYVIDTLSVPDTTPTKFPLRNGDCTTVADRRKFVSNMYYIRDYSVTAGDNIPTLMRSQFDPAGAAALSHQAPEALIEGIDNFRVEFGIDNLSKTSSAVDYTVPVSWADATNKVTPTNRGNGTADEFVRCTTAVPCTAAQVSNVVAVKLYLLARNRETTPGYTDTKTYCLGARDLATGECPTANTVGPFNDGYQRHAYSTTVRLTNVSGRRETPP